MVRKIKDLHIEILYSRFEDQLEKTYSLERDSTSMGIDYRTICYYRDQFVQDFGIRTEVRMSFMS